MTTLVLEHVQSWLVGFNVMNKHLMEEEKKTYILYTLHVDSQGEGPGRDFLDIGLEEAVRKCRKHGGSYEWKDTGLEATLREHHFSSLEDRETAKEIADEFADILFNKDGYSEEIHIFIEDDYQEKLDEEKLEELENSDGEKPEEKSNE